MAAHLQYARGPPHIAARTGRRPGRTPGRGHAPHRHPQGQTGRHAPAGPGNAPGTGRGHRDYLVSPVQNYGP
ncbi:hypothetical protein SGPA1_50452 [Streptomyces misionensis JCM 4497]